MTRNEELTKDVKKLNKYINLSDDRKEIRALNNLIKVLEWAKEQ